MSADSVVSIAWDVLKGYVVVPIKRQFGYVISSKNFADGLKEEARNLENKAERFHNAVEVARNNLRNFYREFTEWEASAEEALKEAGILLDDFEKATKTCCYGTLPDPYCRYQFSRKAKGKIEVIKQLAQKCSEFKESNISFTEPAPGNVTALTPARIEGKDVVQPNISTVSMSSASLSINFRDDDIFESRAQTIWDIKEALAENSNSVVGVHGMGGLGKSTLLEEVRRIISKEKSFDWVAKADVSKNPDIKRIQGEIADALGLTDIKSKESLTGRAELLHSRLEKEEREKKKVLIILDNLWKELDLKSVGIPCRHDNKVTGCKLLLTSRDQKVLQDMHSDEDFRLLGLRETEAKRLFEGIAGDKVHEDEFKPWVEVALHKCAGVPFLIVAMAKRLKNAALYEWKDTLKNIKKFQDKKINDLIDQMLLWSYDQLKEEVKSLLRLCVVYHISKPSLENLVRFCVGLRLFQEIDSMEDARNRLRSHICTLRASSLLLDSEDVDGFKIHDLVCEFVTSVSSRDHPLLMLKDKVKSVTELLKDKPNDYRAMCFPFVDMEELPQELDCPELQVFLLFTNNKSLHVPDSLFYSMKKVMVLNLTGIRLTCSPSPFQSLKNLYTLCLDNCSIDNVSILGELKGLQVLSCVNSNLQQLPKEIGQLTELRLLDLNHCSHLQIIEPGVLERLIKLEDLYMENSFKQWNAMEQTQPTNASLIELNHMKNLFTLHVSIPDPSMLPEDLDVEKLEKHKIQIGSARCRWKHKGLRILDLTLDPKSNVLRKGCIQSILSKIDNLFLDKLNEIEQSICALSQEGFPKLKYLLVQDSPSILYILRWHSFGAFEKLESLLLTNLINLEKICYSHISSSKSFGKLKVIQVESCDKMEVLFPLSLLRGLPQLEEIKLVGCELMRSIVEVDDSGKVELRNLRVLELHCLPNIKNFFIAGTTPSCSTLDNQVGTQIAFFNGQQISIPSLESLTMERLPNMKEIWSNESPLELSNLRSLQVMLCKSLSKVINFGSLVKLHKLHYLCIINCNSVEEIFDLDGTNANGDVKTLSLELTTLKLYNLGSLRCIWNKNPCGRVSFLHLERLEVHNCPNLKFMFFQSMVKSLGQLRDLSVKHCKKMEAIIIEEKGLGLETLKTLVFPMLTSLNLQHLESLMCFSCGKRSLEAQSQDRIKSSSNALFCQQVAFPSLETLSITGLDNIEMIWDNQVVADSFPKLKSLFVDECNKIVTIVPSSISGQLLCLKSLKANTCGSLEVVFELGPLNSIDGSQVALPLKKLMVSRLPKLKCVWKKKLHHQVNFQCLHSISVFKCKSLTSLFPASVAKDLVQLEELEINECGIMELIEKEEGLVPTFDFPKLTSLKLKHLTELKCIYTETHALHWPTLKTLQVYGCNKLEIFASQLENEVLLHKQPLFLIEKVGFQRLGTLEISGLDNLKFLFFPSMVKSLAQLKKLTISDCEKMEAIFMEEEGLGMEKSEFLAFQMLIVLHLEQLSSLTCFSRGKCVRESQSQDCVRSRATTLFNQEVAFPNLENLYIEGMDNIEMIWHDPICANSFSKLKLLSVHECKKLVNVVPSFILGRLSSLKTLMAKGCDSLEVVFKLQPPNPLDGKSAACSPLKALKLDDLSMLNCVWDKELYRHIKFQCLRLVTLKRCARLTSLFSTSMARDLIQLEKLKINQCGIVELIEREGPNELSINVEAIEGPSHELKVASSFPSYFQHMKTLDVSHCHGLSNMFTSTVATNLVGLTKLRISKCEILTEVISDEKGRDGHVVAFNQLKYMELDGLTRLRCFSLGGYTLMFPLLEDIIVNGCPKMKFFYEGRMEATKLERVQVGFNEGYGATKCQYFWKENLNTTIQTMFEEMATFVGTEYMRLFEFPELIGKWHGELYPITSSWRLKSLVVDKCPSFINGLPSSLMLVLKRITRLQVRDCKPLEEIFDLEGLEAVDCTQVLPQLQHLSLINLPKLGQLWNRDLQGTMCFNSLWHLSLHKCSNLRHAFVPSMARCLPNLEEMEIKECDQMEGVIADEEGQGSAKEEITFPNLKWITLEHLPNLTSFLLWKNHKLECPILSHLRIAHCLEMRSLTRQSSMEIDKGTPSLFTPQVQFPRLTWMHLSHMGNLSKIWTDGPQETLTFDCLREVEVRNCKSLENLFPYWVATSLTQLKKIQVESCEIEEIFASRDDTPRSNTTQDLFPELTSLVLHDMPQLKSFCPNLPTLNWPLLEELRVTHCDKLNMLSFAASMNGWVQRDDQQDLSNQEAHSSFERDFPNFKRLLLVNKNIQMIQDGNFPDDIFSKPKALTLACFHDEKAVFPSIFFLERFQNLQSLEVFCSSFEDIFSNEGLVEEGKHLVLENLREIKLNKLHNLKHVWREDSLVSKILQRIETFEIWDCPYLTTIFPNVTSFQNLTKLVVKNSSGLVHLVTVSTVTNLVHLISMTIIGCERMKEVVANDRNRKRKMISFGNLHHLTLQDLPSLECFSSISSCTFRFPWLMTIKVEECPKMKTFSKGTPSTPRLDWGYGSVSLFRYKWVGRNWEKGDDLNTTIQKLSA